MNKSTLLLSPVNNVGYWFMLHFLYYFVNFFLIGKWNSWFYLHVDLLKTSVTVDGYNVCNCDIKWYLFSFFSRRELIQWHFFFSLSYLILFVRDLLTLLAGDLIILGICLSFEYIPNKSR